jgi:hypothetical protein
MIQNSTFLSNRMVAQKEIKTTTLHILAALMMVQFPVAALERMTFLVS